MAAFSGASGIIGPILFTTIVIILGELSPGYDHLTQAISALGENGAPNGATMDANFIVFGVLTLVFASGLYRYDRTVRAGSVAVLTYGLGAILAAFFHCDPGCPALSGSTSQMVHNLDALISFVALSIAPLLVWRSSKKDSRWRSVSNYSLALGSVAISLFGLYLAVDVLVLSPFTGLLQRLFLAPLFAWMIVMSARLFRINRIQSPPNS
jgi:hypothetical membrane protein